MRHLSIDIETYSSVDLKSCGLYKYVQSPDFQILLFGYSWDGGYVRIVDLAQGEQIPAEVIEALNDPNVIKHAFNAQFEWCCLNKFWETPIEQWRCTMINAMYCGFPGRLGVIGSSIGVDVNKQKDRTGSALIKIFCTPNKPTKSNSGRVRTLPHHEPEKWQLFKEYCRQDVVAEMAILKKLENFPLPEEEQKLWELDIKINSTGVLIDEVLVEGAIHCSEVITEELTREAIDITGLDNPNSVAQLKNWLSDELEEDVQSLSKAAVRTMLANVSEDKVQRVLEIRQELSKTSVKKYAAMLNAVGLDGRVRGTFQFYGASRTGRWAGRLIQLHNLPQNHLETLSLARDCVQKRKCNTLKVLYGNIPDTLSQLIRTAFIPKPGSAFLVADFSAIEARIIAWLAGEKWRQEVFATHGKIYEASAAAMFNVPIESIKKGSSLRQKGKVAELALGYGGSKGALINMGALEMGLTEDELPEIVEKWRAANPMITKLWRAFGNAAVETVSKGIQTTINGVTFSREIDFENELDFMTMQLPNGRKLYYNKPFIANNKFDRPAVHYYGVDVSGKMEAQSTFGGKLVENCVQAIARDCLAESMRRLDKLGYRIVMHVHDEIVIEGDPAELKRICDVMGRSIEWAPGLILKADGFSCDYYMKD